jgi:hypothetical protein
MLGKHGNSIKLMEDDHSILGRQRILLQFLIFPTLSQTSPKIDLLFM